MWAIEFTYVLLIRSINSINIIYIDIYYILYIRIGKSMLKIIAELNGEIVYWIIDQNQFCILIGFSVKTIPGEGFTLSSGELRVEKIRQIQSKIIVHSLFEYSYSPLFFL